MSKAEARWAKETPNPTANGVNDGARYNLNLGLTETTASNEHAVVLSTRLETSCKEHESASYDDTSATSKVIRNVRSKGNGGQRPNVLNGAARDVSSRHPAAVCNLLVQPEGGALGLTKERNPMRNSLKTVCIGREKRYADCDVATYSSWNHRNRWC